MKQAKRMTLIPEEMLERYEQRQRLATGPLMANMIQKDTQLADTLERPDIGDDDKQKLFNAQLERYLDIKHQKDATIPTVRVATSGNAPVEAVGGEQNEQLQDAVILEGVPKTMRDRAARLLDRLKARPDMISWNGTGQVRIEGEPVPLSNISDLVSDAVREKERKNFNPAGAKAFFRVLTELNVPKEIARNEKRWKAADEVQQSPTYFDRLLLKRRQTPITPVKWETYIN